MVDKLAKLYGCPCAKKKKNYQTKIKKPLPKHIKLNSRGVPIF